MKNEKIKLSSRQMILDIGSMRQFAMQLLETPEYKYHALLSALLKTDFYNDDNSPMPSLKELSTESGIKYGRINHQLRKIYEELILPMEEKDEFILPLFHFEEITYIFRLRGNYKDRIIRFETNSLPVIPRIGEMVEVPFFKAYLNVIYFHVENIHHSFSDRGQEIHINLLPGSYNRYWYFRKDKAVEEKEIWYRDLIELDDWELKEKLGIGR